jgi:hypothetical protein
VLGAGLAGALAAGVILEWSLVASYADQAKYELSLVWLQLTNR